MSIARRSFFLGTASLGLVSLAQPVMTGRLHRLTQRLRALSGDPVSARVVGKAYAELFAHEIGPRLPDLILSSLQPDPRVAAIGDDDALIALTARRVRDDFAQGLTVTVGGWVLSRTEARLCALWI